MYLHVDTHMWYVSNKKVFFKTCITLLIITWTQSSGYCRTELENNIGYI